MKFPLGHLILYVIVGEMACNMRRDVMLWSLAAAASRYDANICHVRPDLMRNIPGMIDQSHVKVTFSMPCRNINFQRAQTIDRRIAAF